MIDCIFTENRIKSIHKDDFAWLRIMIGATVDGAHLLGYVINKYCHRFLYVTSHSVIIKAINLIVGFSLFAQGQETWY